MDNSSLVLVPMKDRCPGTPRGWGGGGQVLQGVWEAFHFTERLEHTGLGDLMQNSKLSIAYGYPAIKLSGQRPQAMFWAEKLISALTVSPLSEELMKTGWECSSAGWQRAWVSSLALH